MGEYFPELSESDLNMGLDGTTTNNKPINLVID